MRTTKYSILVGYAKIIEKYGKNCSYAKTSTMLDLLHKFTRVRISARAFYKHTADLRKEGFIKSFRKYGRNKNGTLYRRTSHVYITVQGYVALAVRGWHWALSQAKKLKQKLIPQKTEPARAIITANKTEEIKEANTTKEIVQKVISQGISLYDYLLNKGQRKITSRIDVEVCTNKPQIGPV